MSAGLQLPGRGDSSLADTAPFAEIEGRPVLAARPRVASLAIHPGFLRALGIPLVEGRDFSDDDRADTPPVAIVNRSFARAYLNGETPVGHRLKLDSWRLLGDGRARIVGVAEDLRHDGSLADVEPLVYVPFAQRPEWGAPMIVKTRGDPLRFLPAVREAVQAIDPDQPIDNVGTLEQRLAASLALDRFRALLLTAFSSLAVAIAAVGLFAVLSYATAERVREIGLKMALGARAGDVARAVVAQGMLPVCAGIFVGALGASALAKLVDSLLFEVAATDAAALGAAIAVLLAVAGVACAVPARRAACIDPSAALRE
ncbi:MAG TPA: ABC transporter permease [Gammaproteobacteria bacterium]|nr:ABC transporter permease [Gammaproteobacteria bacterium]